ncbi:autotransporter domain-containing esterase [Pseudoxanthomonas sangjuensis]|uniref:autotransporter domain-containing protein n=1 Tax=Pseudoxanthomonas sangjuensis TaxID=1503750 RepID=UPI0013907217|nr:autotransporter domain-containing protein [Pseudoxanthomonas sangjuensis]KAF1711014.1 autotransporter domain-containing esterase [Pseudoxanthomonas sangjuensis]
MSLSRIPVRSVLALALAAAAPAFAQSEYSGTVFFGDSLTDSGAFRPGLVQVGGSQAVALGRFTTNPGLVWSEFLADFYGHPGDAVALNQGGENYAVGGARVATEGTSPFGPIPSLATQVGAYLTANGGRADPNALYTVWGGANDLFAVAAGEPQTTIVTAVTTQIGLIGQLQQAGARYVLVPNIPDLGKTPSFLAQGAAGSAGGTQLAMAYNNALYAGLQSAGLQVIPLDTFGFLGEVIANPAAYGYSNVTGTACGATSSLTCSPANYVDPNAPSSYLFADGVHPTTRTHEILAQYAESVLEGPRQIAILPLSAANTGRARADMVALHVDGKPASDGMRWWGDLRGDNQRYENGDLYDGLAPAGSFGVDWARGSMVFGGFVGYGRGKLDFGPSTGGFDQADATLGGFIGWYGDNLWVNGQVSYTQLSFDVDRDVQLGPVKRRHSGSPDGDNLTAAIAAGYEFGDGAFRHGPVAGVVSQSIEVDGYAESGGGSTALSYPKQELDSLVGSAGWQASFAINEHARPYARLTWDHEFEDAPEQAHAQLQSIPQAGEYAVPGLAVDDDYGTLRFGVRTQLFGLQADIGASSTFERDGGDNATVFLTVGGSF